MSADVSTVCRASRSECAMPLLKPCTVDGVLHTAVAPVQTVTWSAIPTPSGTLFGSSGASAYSTARSVRCSITLL